MTNLFKKAAALTDIHFGLKSNSQQHNEDCLKFVDWFIETAKSEGCDTGFFLGDWHHNRASINVETLHYSLSALEKLNDAFENFYFLVGNHDLFYKSKRDVHSVAWAKHLPNIHLIDNLTTIGGVTLAPWLVGEEWSQVKKMSGKYLFGHLELPNFLMNAHVEMPDHGELNSNHLQGFEEVYSGHFHKRQQRGNITYIGNAFPHNYSDVSDDERGMMILSWGETPKFRAWPGQPRFRIYKLSDALERPNDLLLPDMHCRINLDIDISFEESNYIRETLIPKHHLRELTLIPMKVDIETDVTDYSQLKFESVDSIIQTQINELAEGAFDKRLLLDIYRNL